MKHGKKLNDDQVARFERDGYVFLPDVFSPAEVGVLAAEARRVFTLDREEVWREDNGAPRTAFAAHLYSEPFRRLGAHPRLVGPVMQILGEEVYMHQFKVNAKAAFDGAVWQWHQDYGTWSRDDEMPEPRAMNVALFLSEVNEFNAPLLFIPGSHKGGCLEAAHDTATTSYPLWTIDDATIGALVERNGMIAAKGTPGTALFFHGNIVHGSGSNMSPWDRVVVYISLCHVDNHIRQFKRPAWIAHRDFTAIESLADDCLQELAREGAAAE